MNDVPRRPGDHADLVRELERAMQNEKRLGAIMVEQERLIQVLRNLPGGQLLLNRALKILDADAVFSAR